MSNPSQKLKGGDGSHNTQVGGDYTRTTNYSFNVAEEREDFLILNEIFENVIAQLNDYNYETDLGHIFQEEKIKINFKDERDRERVRRYFRIAYEKIPLIQKIIKAQDQEIHRNLQGHIFERYNKLCDEIEDNILILERLFEEFTIPGKSNNERYSNLTRAYVLFFFDDCTIFEKTANEI